MALLKKLAGETAIYGLSSILSRVVNWVMLTPYFTSRVFADQPADYGRINDLYFWIALLLAITTFRMETAFFRFGRKAEDLEGAFASAFIFLGSIVLLLLFSVLLGLPYLSAVLHYGDRPDLVGWFVAIVALDTLTTIPFARLRLEGRPMKFAALKILAIGINLLAIFFFFETGPWLANQNWGWMSVWYRPEDKVAYVFIANFLASAGVLVYFLPSLMTGVLARFNPQLWRKMLGYALPLIPAGVAAIVNQLVGVPMIKAFGGGSLSANLSQAGIFAAAAKFAVLMNLFTQAYNYAAEPFFFKHSGQSQDRRVYGRATQAFALVGCIAFLGIMFYLDVIQNLIGRNYREALGIVPVLLMANLFLGLYYNFSIWFKLADRTEFATYIALSGMVITLVINAWLIPNPKVSYFAPAWASLACYGFMAFAAWISGRKYYPIPYALGRIAGYIGITMLFFILGLGAEQISGERIWLSTTLKTGLLAAFLLFIGWIEREQIAQLRGRSPDV
jgi:O-antigen/teichoic acid export membrane protein